MEAVSLVPARHKHAGGCTSTHNQQTPSGPLSGTPAGQQQQHLGTPKPQGMP